ncbi:MAG: hypothetical protein QM743_00455 [Chitinophagaceae bacterium]
MDSPIFGIHPSDLARLAAKVAGTDISLINLIDAYTQWTVSSHGLEVDELPGAKSDMQLHHQQENYLEISDP